MAELTVSLHTLHSIVRDMRATRYPPFTDITFDNASLLRCYAVSTGIWLFYVLLTVHLNIFILLIKQFDAQI